MTREAISLADFERLGRARLPRFLADFVAGWADDGVTLRAGRDAFAACALIPHVLADVAARHSGVDLFGRRWHQPFGIAPMGGMGLIRPGGDALIAAAAAAAGVPFVLSGASFTPLEEAAAACPGVWFQPLLPSRDDDAAPLIDRAAAAGVGALVVTADLAVFGRREADLRNRFDNPVRLSPRLLAQAAAHPGWLAGSGWAFRRGTPPLPNLSPKDPGMRGRQPITWRTIAAARRRWTGPLVIKGILAPEDASRAVDAGADGLIVSNHGGRQLDGAVPSLKALGGVCEAAGSVPVLLDGGVRRGTDIAKAIAGGAAMAFVGRPIAWALSASGVAGVKQAIRLLADDVDRTLALTGCASPPDWSSLRIV